MRREGSALVPTGATYSRNTSESTSEHGFCKWPDCGITNVTLGMYVILVHPRGESGEPFASQRPEAIAQLGTIEKSTVFFVQILSSSANMIARKGRILQGLWSPQTAVWHSNCTFHGGVPQSERPGLPPQQEQFVPDPENGKVQVKVRRRRTHRHRRNRAARRAIVFAVAVVFVAATSTAALRYFSPSLFGKQSIPTIPEPSQAGLNRTALNQILLRTPPSRPVYPYSVVPGGVEDAKELKWVAEHDPVVAAHYAGFNYARAQVVRLTLARTAYVSYRIGNHIYWTHRRITLHKGEKLITDGRMTARGRCANRVEGTPQQEASPAEPSAEKFDQPLREGSGTAMQSPGVPFESALNRAPAPGLEAAAPLTLYDPFVGGSWVPISPPPLPAALCGPAKKSGAAGTTGDSGNSGKKKTVCTVSGGPEPIPEPGTWITFASGLSAILWQARRKLSRA